MRAALVLTLALATSSAQARCYSRWQYPWPQSCKVTSAHAPAPKVAKIAQPPARPPTIVRTIEDPARAQAIEALKQALRVRAVQTLELQTIGLTKKENE
jgi:hypothetical protein